MTTDERANFDLVQGLPLLWCPACQVAGEREVLAITGNPQRLATAGEVLAVIVLCPSGHAYAVPIPDTEVPPNTQAIFSTVTAINGPVRRFPGWPDHAMYTAELQAEIVDVLRRHGFDPEQEPPAQPQPRAPRPKRRSRT